MIFAYLGDWIIWASSFKQCLQAMEMVCKVIQKYAFIINQEKSVFVPTHVIQWLGQQAADSLSTSSFSRESQGLHHQIHQVQIHHPSSTTESCGTDQFCLCGQFFGQDIPQEGQPIAQRVSEASAAGYSCSSVTRAQSKVFVLTQAASLEVTRSLAHSSSNCGVVHGRIQHGMGLPYD